MITKFFLSISVLTLILFIVWSNSDITRLATKAINPLLPFNPEAKSPSEQKSIKLFNCIDNYYRNENSYLELIEELFCDSISWEYIGPEKRILKSDIKNELGNSIENYTLIISPIQTAKSMKNDLEIVNFDVINNWTIKNKKNRKCYHISLTFKQKCIKEFHRTESTIDCRKYLYILDNLQAISTGLYIVLVFVFSLILSGLFSVLGQENKSNLAYFISLLVLVILSNVLGVSDHLINFILKLVIK